MQSHTSLARHQLTDERQAARLAAFITQKNTVKPNTNLRFTRFRIGGTNERNTPTDVGKILPPAHSSPFTISVKSLQSSTLKARISLTEALNHAIFESLVIAL